MATNRKTPQHSFPLYPDISTMLEEAVKLTGQSLSRTTCDAIRLGLKHIISQHQSASGAPVNLKEMQDKINQIWEKVIGEEAHEEY